MRGTLFAAALVIGAPVVAGSQTRERKIAEYNWDKVNITITSKPGRIEVVAFASPNFTQSFHYVDDLNAFADTAEKILLASLPKPPAGELVKYEVSSKESTPHFSLTREVSATGSRYSLFFADKYVVNTASARISLIQAKTFLAALRRAASQATEMEWGDRPVGADPLPSYSAEIAPTVIAAPAAPVGNSGAPYSGYLKAKFTLGADGLIVKESISAEERYDSPYEQRIKTFLSATRWKPARKAGRSVPIAYDGMMKFPVHVGDTLR